MADYSLKFIIDAENNAKNALNQVKDQMDTVQDKVKSMEPAFKKMAMVGTAGFAAVSGAVALSVKNYITAGDEVQKMALRTGFATESLSELKYALDLSGASIEGLETGIKKMSRFISDARDGNEAMAKTIDKLGLSVEDFDNASPEKTFFELAEGIAEIEDPMERASLAMDIFGKTGTDLLPMFAAGKEGIEAMRQEARNLGIVFDEEAANKAAKLNDAMTKMRGGMMGVQYALAEAFLPILDQLIQKIMPIITKIQEWAKEHSDLVKIIFIVVAAIFGIIAAIGTLGLVIGPLIAGFGGMIAVLTFLISPIGLVIVAITALIAIGVLLYKKWNEISEFFKLTWEGIKIITEETINSILNKIENWLTGIKNKITTTWNRIKDFFSELWSSITGIFQDAYNSITNKVEAIINLVNRVKNAVSNAINIIGGFVGGVGEKIFGGGQFGIPNVPRTGLYLLHRGETVTPSGRGGGGGITLNINGGYYLSEDAAVEMGDLIIEKLKRHFRI